jgi:hypothetical protein
MLSLGISFNKAMYEFYNFCNYNNKKVKIFSYGNDYDIIKKNLILNGYEDNHKYFKWEESFFDYVILLKKYNIPTEKYSSGTIFKYFNLDVKATPHDSEWDVMSLFYSLYKLIEINKL